MASPPAIARGELSSCILAAASFVGLRSFVFLRYEQLFDSDQAIVGLMAKHASELRGLPLFFYGQHYMLGVQAWVAVPFFWIGGPTVAMLRLPIVLINAAVAVAIVAALTRCGIRPIWALAAVLPLVATPPCTSAELVSTLGASIEPFAYVLLLWSLRRRPLAFGALLCVGTLHREFTIFALPAIIVVHWRSRISWSAIAYAAAGFVAVWLAVDLLKVRGGLAPFGTTDAPPGSLVQEALFMGQIVSWKLGPYLARTRDLLARGVPDLLGLRIHPLSLYGLPGSGSEGSTWAATAFIAAIAVCGCRIVPLLLRSNPPPIPALRLCTYLALVGAQAMLAYGLSSGVDPGAPPVLRYVLLALLIPVGLFAAYFLIEPRRAWKWTAAILILGWAAPNVWANAQLVRELALRPPPAEHRILADYLRAHRIKYGWAGYWDCYIVDFLARERVVLASTDIVRIPFYQAQVERNQSNAVTIRRMPCTEGTRVAEWCIADPPTDDREGLAGPLTQPRMLIGSRRPPIARPSELPSTGRP